MIKFKGPPEDGAQVFPICMLIDKRVTRDGSAEVTVTVPVVPAIDGIIDKNRQGERESRSSSRLLPSVPVKCEKIEFIPVIQQFN